MSHKRLMLLFTSQTDGDKEPFTLPKPTVRTLITLLASLISLALFAYSLWGLITQAEYVKVAAFALLAIAIFLGGASIRLKVPGTSFEIRRLADDNQDAE